MIPQSCSDIHYSLIESNKNNFVFNNVCCLEYIIKLEEYYRDNMNEIYFYKKFIKLIYELDKQNLFDFPNYNKDSLKKFIFILNKASCYFYIHRKIKYSKFLSNLSVKISQIIFKSDVNNNINNQYENNGHTSEEINDKYLVSNIYNNACCNYLQTFSYNKCLKFLEYSFKNIEENDINDKLIYYNNLLIVKAKNIINYDNINIEIKALEKLIKSRKEFFNNLYGDNLYCNNGENSEKIKIKLKSNDLIRLNDEIKNKNLNFKLEEENKINVEKENINLKLKISNNRNPRHSERDLNKRLNNIIEKIEEFEGILQNEKIINMLKDKNTNNEKIINELNESIKLVNNKEEININNINIENNKTKESEIKNNENNISLPQKKEKEKISFDMLDNMIEEFKKENQEKEELSKKLIQEKKEIEKQKEKEQKKNDNNNIIINQNKENNNENQAPKKAPRIKKLFQKVIGTTHKEPKKTKLGELFQSLMGGIKEEKKEENDMHHQIFEEKKEEIKVQNEKDNNFITLDDDNDINNTINNDSENVNINNSKKEEKEEKENEINQDNNSQSCGYGFTIKVNLDPTSYNYDATTLYQKNES